jgi:hypothetical protein
MFMCVSWINIQKIVQDVLFERDTLMEQSELEINFKQSAWLSKDSDI